MNDTSLVIVGSRRRGRRPLSAHGPSTDVCVALPPDMYDRAFAIATKERITVPEVIRRAVARALPREIGDTK